MLRRNSRPTTTQAGYGNTHQQERARWAPIVAQGHTPCHETRCLEAEAGRGRTIHPGQRWHLAHNTQRTAYLGPAHARCNIGEGNRRVPNRGYLRRRAASTTTLHW